MVVHWAERWVDKLVALWASELAEKLVGWMVDLMESNSADQLVCYLVAPRVAQLGL